MRAWYASPYPTAAPLLWVCHGCFKYMASSHSLAAHRRTCTTTHPPGRIVYQRGAHIVWEVDGAAHTLYAQNLCLFGKLFIDHKTIMFDVAPFYLYVLTDASSQFDHVLGFFSKEKVSYDDYNLAVIVVFPPYQRKGYGTLLMELSYYLSRGARVAGTPERPLSELGLKGYIAFWSARVIRALLDAYDHDGPARAALAGRPSAPPRVEGRRAPRGARGWAGEARAAVVYDTAASTLEMPATTTLARVAAAAGLRPDDATLALAHAGLLQERGDVLQLSRADVAAAAARLRVRPPVLDEAYCVTG